MSTNVIELFGISKDGHCGYCGGHDRESLGTLDEAGSPLLLNESLGFWAHTLFPATYQSLLDCGWRRSGKYVYKPIMDKTCCPQYTIRLDSLKFYLSRAQRRVLRQMNEFLQHDTKPKSGPIKEEVPLANKEAENSTSKSSVLTNSINENEMKTVSNLVNKKDIDDGMPKKKKVMRRERCYERWQKQGLNVEEMKEKRLLKEQARVRTVESYIEESKPDWKHRLEVKLVSVKSDEINSRMEESFALYKKYQVAVHKDDPFDVRTTGYKRFLLDSPFFGTNSDREHSDERPAFGAYHQWYILDGKLIAVGVCDILPKCFSSKYMFYDPDYNFLSLGTYTALREIAFTKFLSKTRPELKYYYMGYYIHSCPKMRYKGKYRPSDLLCDHSLTWVPLDECSKMLDASESRFVQFRPDQDADRLTRQDLNILTGNRMVPYSMLSVIKPEYAALETDDIRKKLDDLAGYLAGSFAPERLAIYMNEIEQLTNDENDDDCD